MSCPHRSDATVAKHQWTDSRVHHVQRCHFPSFDCCHDYHYDDHFDDYPPSSSYRQSWNRPWEWHEVLVPRSAPNDKWRTTDHVSAENYSMIPSEPYSHEPNGIYHVSPSHATMQWYTFGPSSSPNSSYTGSPTEFDHCHHHSHCHCCYLSSLTLSLSFSWLQSTHRTTSQTIERIEKCPMWHNAPCTTFAVPTVPRTIVSPPGNRWHPVSVHYTCSWSICTVSSAQTDQTKHWRTMYSVVWYQRNDRNDWNDCH